MDNSANRFLQLYNDLDNVLMERYGQYDNSFSYIAKYAFELMKSSNYKIHEKGRILNEIRQIRNALVHDFDMNKDSLISISDKTLSFLEKEIVELTHPKCAIDICTPYKKLLFAKLDDDVNKIMKIMLEKGFLQFPIIDDYQHLLGVLSPNTIMQYIALKNKNISDEKVYDLDGYFPIKKHISEHYTFVKEKELMQNVANLFDKMYENGKRLAVIFVTKDGREDQPILGVITPFDILKLDNI